MEENVLYHYGVLGMKWGIRKKDRKKKITFSSPFKAKPKATNNSAENKPISKMTDEELRFVINRLQLEQQYSQLVKKPSSKGKSFAKQFIAENSQAIAKTFVQKYANRKIDKILDEMFKEPKPKNSNDKKKS